MTNRKGGKREGEGREGKEGGRRDNKISYLKFIHLNLFNMFIVLFFNKAHLLYSYVDNNHVQGVH